MNYPQNRRSPMDNLTKVFWKNEAVRLNKELDKEKAKFDKLQQRLIALLTMDGFGYHPEKEQNKIIKRDVIETINKCFNELSSKQEKMK
jgi:hypothetical protein